MFILFFFEEALIVAFATSSSLATLTVTLKCKFYFIYINLRVRNRPFSIKRNFPSVFYVDLMKN